MQRIIIRVINKFSYVNFYDIENFNQIYQNFNRLNKNRLNKNEIFYNERDRNKTKIKKINTRNNIAEIEQNSFIKIIYIFIQSFKYYEKHCFKILYKKHRETKNFFTMRRLN